jgi:hypothetical protein
MKKMPIACIVKSHFPAHTLMMHIRSRNVAKKKKEFGILKAY